MKQSVTIFYFSILNLPQRFNSALANVHLISICNSKELDLDDGYNVILGYIVDEIKKPKTNGFKLYIPHKGNVQVFGSIAQFTADNLGMNKAFNLVRSFNCDFYCTLRYSAIDQMKEVLCPFI